MSTVFIVQVNSRKGDGKTMGPYSTRDKAVVAVMAAHNWEPYIEGGIHYQTCFCDPAAGFWSTEDESYQIEERAIQ